MILATLLAAASATPTAAQSIELLHQSFDNIPGANEIHGFGDVAVNDSGEWVITARMLEFATNMSAGYAIFGPSGLLLYSENAVPSLGTASFYRSLRIGITHNGDFVSRAQIKEGPTTYTIAVMVNDQVVCRQNRLANVDGLPADTEWTGIGAVEVTPQGTILVTGGVRRPGVSGYGVAVEYRVEGSSVVGAELYATVNMAPDGSPQSLVSISGMSASEDGQHLLLGSPATLEFLLLQGDDILMSTSRPSVVPGADYVISNFSPVGSVNSRGDSAFIAAQTQVPRHVLVKNGRLFHRQSDTFPAIAPYQLERFSTLISNSADKPYLLESGALLWSARWSHPDVARGGGLFLDDRLIIEEGVTRVGNKVMSGVRSDRMRISPNGRWLIFECGLNDVGQTNYTQGVVRVDLSEGTEYCAPTAVNSAGALGSITATAPLVAPGEPLGLVAHGLPTASMGYFLVAQSAGFVVAPGGSQGTLCLSEPIGRFRNQGMSTGPGGYLSTAVDSGALPLTPAQAVLAGETWRFQAWYRDMNPGPTSNFTSAVSVTF